VTRDDIGDATRVLVERGNEKHIGAPGDESVRISPLDRGFLYGDGVFETLRCYDGEPAFAGRHAERLNDALEAVGIGRRFDAAEFGDALELVARDEWLDGDVYLRVTVSRGVRRGILEPTETEPTVVWTAKPLNADERVYTPASVETAGPRRPLGALGEHKTLNYLPSVLARAETNEDADEALMLGTDGSVGSGSVSNVFIVNDGVVKTPAENVRRGVTREVVLEIAEELGYETRECDVSPAELSDSDAVFLTNSTWGVREVKETDGKHVESHESVERISSAYLDRAVPS